MAGKVRHDGDEIVGYRFSDPRLLQQALTHRSAGMPNNERLEFLGDGVVNLLIADALYRCWPKANEGVLTRARAELVREASLAAVARTLHLGERLTLGPGEMKSGGYRRDSILADALEALIAAIYLDGGYETCNRVILPWFEKALSALPTGRPEKDAKTRLQEWLQARQKPLPVYQLISEIGDDHAKHFHMRCVLDEPALSATGEGSSRRQAEQAAATIILERLDE
ncbi:MAG: ribonuclease III [Xanthomonadaceae bacterium]|nr:ribonuclease III [Xanthomonadaceae bacterium]